MVGEYGIAFPPSIAPVTPIRINTIHVFRRVTIFEADKAPDLLSFDINYPEDLACLYDTAPAIIRLDCRAFDQRSHDVIAPRYFGGIYAFYGQMVSDSKLYSQIWVN
jgi:hypothetical protein